VLAGKEFQARLVRIAARPATEDEILACHEREYFESVKARIEAGVATLDYSDTMVCGDSFAAAQLAAGGAMAAVDAVVADAVGNAFCAVRPPGHHARPNAAMGFCIFNNVAVAARYAQRRHGLSRVLIADWDVHHGNGTQEIFYDDPSVFFFSVHQSPWYPGTGWENETGSGKGEGTKMNRPFPAGAGGNEIVAAFREMAAAADEFKPDLVLVSAGFDSRAGDPLGLLNLTDEDFAALTGICLDVARRHARGRLVSVLEGGYNLTGLASSVAAHVRTLMGA